MNRYKFLEYIKNNFNIDVMSYELIGELYDALYIYTSTKAPIEYNGHRIDYYIPILIEKLNNSRIDITLDELIENGVVE